MQRTIEGQNRNCHWMKRGFFAIILLMMVSPKFGMPSDVFDLARDNGYEMEEVVVTATRAEARKAEIAANVTVVSKKDIEKLHCR